MRNRILVLAALVLAGAGQGYSQGRDLELTAGRSVVIDYAGDIERIAASNPDVADAVAVSAREVLVNAKAPGTASVVIWSKAGMRTLYAITVEQNLEPLRQLIKKTFPSYDIELQAAKDSLSLTGVVPSQAASDRAAALLAPFAKAVVSNLRVVPPGPEKQVLLRVKFAELNRTATTALGMNLISTGAANTPGLVSTGQFQAATLDELQGSIPAGTRGASAKFTISDALNVFAFRPDLNLGAFIKALQNRGVLQILAEPNLVTTDGKDASFLVGGEFPIPVVQGGANAGAVTIMFKEYGIRLTFQPNITEHGTIRMYVKPEVSTIDLTNSVLYSGFTIPALASRRMETNIELGQGQSFVIAGLIDERVTESLSKIPGLADIPVLGALFKSRQEQKTATELIVMVTPEITTPVSRQDAKPLVMPRPFMPLGLLEREGGAPQPRPEAGGGK
jgi:pilus assembly protein CpaC